MVRTHVQSRQRSLSLGCLPSIVLHAARHHGSKQETEGVHVHENLHATNARPRSGSCRRSRAASSAGTGYMPMGLTTTTEGGPTATAPVSPSHWTSPSGQFCIFTISWTCTWQGRTRVRLAVVGAPVPLPGVRWCLCDARRRRKADMAPAHAAVAPQPRQQLRRARVARAASGSTVPPPPGEAAPSASSHTCSAHSLGLRHWLWRRGREGGCDE